MKFFKKPIFTGFSPNLTKRDVKLAFSFLIFPWNWKKIIVGTKISEVENWLQRYFGIPAIAFDSGRSALYFALKALEVGEDDEVLVQSYTCLVVINAIKWTGAKPIYVDVKDDCNMSVEDLSKKITNKTKALIVQHTFGRPANLEQLISVARKSNLKIIEDCAHSLGAKYQEKLTGTMGDIGMLSFGSDKILSCVRGGALLTADLVLFEKIKNYQKNLSFPKLGKTIQHLLHYPIFYLAKPIYNLGIGKWLLALAKYFNIYNKIIYTPEKFGLPVVFYPAKLANSLANILLNQFLDLSKVIKHQKTIAHFYEEKINNPIIIKPEWNDETIWLRYNIFVENPKKLHVLAKKNGIILGNWYDAPVAPKDVDLTIFDYQKGTCPNDENLALKSINLPTDRQITLLDAQKIVDIINNYGN